MAEKGSPKRETHSVTQTRKALILCMRGIEADTKSRNDGGSESKKGRFFEISSNYRYVSRRLSIYTNEISRSVLIR